ncbi:MAG: AAA family ATPase, partial [Chitinivibrionales bacterium]
MRISIPDPSLIVLIGVAGSGKSAFAHRWFSPTSVVSSDFCRALISDDEENQSVSPDAFRLLHFIIGKRLKYNRLTVCDATNIDTRHRKRILSIRDTY